MRGIDERGRAKDRVGVERGSGVGAGVDEVVASANCLD